MHDHSVRSVQDFSACLFELQLNDKQLELVTSEKLQQLDRWGNVKMLFGNLLLGWLVDMQLVMKV